mgnify:CR=1 FL=1
MSKQPQEISTEELAGKVSADDPKIIDIRPLEAYNGWALQGEPNGGHIRGAKSIPFHWTQYMDWLEVLSEKNLSPEDPVTIYGYDANEANSMAQKLFDQGFEDVSVYNHFVEEWSPNPELPTDYLARYRQLVYPEWVKQLIDGDNPPAYENERFVICHSHYDHYEDCREGHIPGAIALNTNDLESEVTWNRRSPEELEEILRKHGITHDTTVVVYGRFSFPKYDDPYPGKSAGHLGAIRCAVILLYAGVKDVKILNGGITSWENAGYELSKEEVSPEAVDSFGIEIPGRPDYMIDTPDAKRLIASENGELVSVRSWEEYIGNFSGYHYIEKLGRIPGSVFGNCGTDAYHMENYRNFDHTMREYSEIADKWIEGGIIPEKHIAFYCGTGWRGSEAFMNAYLMGWPNISVYDGGWFEWSSDPDNPIATGEPESN